MHSCDIGAGRGQPFKVWNQKGLDQNKKLHFQCLPWFGQICLVVWSKFGASKNVSVEEYVCMYLTDYWKCISLKKTLDFP